jgi:predicted GNAT family acetyltransferase
MATTDNTHNETNGLTVVQDDALNRFEIQLDDDVAFLRYREEPGLIRLIHTEVPEKYGGRGIAGRLAAFGLNYARERGLRVVPTCPYVRAYIDRHPEYADLIAA